MGSWDSGLFLDVNRVAQSSGWAHGVVRAYAEYAGLAILAFLVVLAVWRGRGGIYGGGSTEAISDGLWAGLAGLISLLVCVPLVHAVGRPRPYAGIHQSVLVLVPRAGGFAFPNIHSAIAGAVITGLWFSRSRLIAFAATLAGLLLAFSWVYVGAAYPLDVLVGLLLGVLVAAGLRKLIVPVLEGGLEWLAKAPPLRAVLGVPDPSRSLVGGPALRPAGAGNLSAAVRILEPDARMVPAGTASAASLAAANQHVPARMHVRPKGGPAVAVGPTRAALTGPGEPSSAVDSPEEPVELGGTSQGEGSAAG